MFLTKLSEFLRTLIKCWVGVRGESKMKKENNIGKANSGRFNTGNRNTGHFNAGHYNVGNYNAGDHNAGNNNAGNYNTGAYNTGCRNTGHYNTGHFNTGNRNPGSCNTTTPTVRLFNKDSGWEFDSKEYQSFLAIIRQRQIPLCHWLYEHNMSEKEKEDNPTYKTTGGYLRINSNKYNGFEVTDKERDFLLSLIHI